MNESRRQILLDTPHTETATGAIASFETDMVGRAKEVKVEIEPVQDLHGYENPWPAGGGKNKLASNATKDVTIAGAQTIVVSLTKNVAEITIDRDMTASIGYRFNDGSIETVLPAGKYFFSTNITNQQAGSGFFIFDATTATILGRARAEGGARISLSAETTVRLGLSLSAGTKAGTYWFQLESGSTATAYEPYSNICPISGWTGCEIKHSGVDVSDPTTTPISWADEAGTVYGGTLDWEKDGTVTLTKTMASVDLGTLTWAKVVSGANRFQTELPTAKAVNNGSIANAICEAFPTQSATYTYGNKGYIAINVASLIWVSATDLYSDAATFKAAMSGVQLVYELATPVTYTLTPQEALVFLRGTNHVWNDINDTTVTYWTHKTGDSV